METNNTNARLIKQTPERKVQLSVQSYLKSTDWHIQQPFVNNPGKSQTHDPQAGTSKSVHLPCPHLNHKEEKNTACQDWWHVETKPMDWTRIWEH